MQVFCMHVIKSQNLKTLKWKLNYKIEISHSLILIVFKRQYILFGTF